MQIIIPDTNALNADPFLEGAHIRTILAAESQTNIRLVIPEVVVDELRNHVEEEVNKVLESAVIVRRDVARLSGLSQYAVDFNISPELRKAVLGRFDRRIGEFAKEGRILMYPSASPKELSRRSIKDQAPFKDSDRGMRDTLIWLTTKEYVINGQETGCRVSLVTKDKAFLNKEKTKLNESLTLELEGAGIPHDAVTVLPTLQSVVESFVSGKLPDVEWVKVAIEDGEIDDFTPDSDAVQLEVTDWILKNPESLEVDDYFFVEFDVAEDVALQNIEKVLDLGGGKFLVESEWTCEVAAEGFEDPNFYFGDSLQLVSRFNLSSIVEVENGRLSVRSHEVTDIDVLEFTKTG